MRRSMILSLFAFGALFVVGCAAAPARDDDNGADESSELRRRRDAGAPVAKDAAPPPPAPASRYGFTEGARVIGKGVGTTTRNEGPSYQCKRRTHTQLPCGGWVQVSTDSGQTVVSFHASNHYDWWENVSGHHYLEGMNQVWPPSYSRFWDVTATLALDATGHAEHHDVRRDVTSNRVISTADYVLQAEDGAITLSFQNAGDPLSCNRTEDTCSFRVTAQ